MVSRLQLKASAISEPRKCYYLIREYVRFFKDKHFIIPIPAVTFPLDSVTKQPEKVAVIVDGFCGSSTEYFISLTHQSKKLTTYGSNTIGMMDYEGMSNPTALPYNKYILTIPIGKSSWTDSRPIDLPKR